MLQARLPLHPLARIRRSLSLRTAVALGAGAASAIVFVELADEVLEGEATRLDYGVARWIQSLEAPALEAVMRVLTHLGSAVGVAVVVAIVAGWALLRRSRALAGVLVAGAVVAEASSWLLKSVFRRERPEPFLLDVVPLTTYAFPSTHAMVSAAVYGTIAIIVARLRPSLAPLAYIAALLLVIAVGFSRIVLGVHWTTDVLAGFAAGGLVLVAAMLALWHVHARPAEYPAGPAPATTGSRDDAVASPPR